jgi:hypothetical protein
MDDGRPSSRFYWTMDDFYLATAVSVYKFSLRLSLRHYTINLTHLNDLTYLLTEIAVPKFGTALYSACEFVRLLVCSHQYVSLNRLVKIPCTCSKFIHFCLINLGLSGPTVCWALFLVLCAKHGQKYHCSKQRKTLYLWWEIDFKID